MGRVCRPFLTRSEARQVSAYQVQQQDALYQDCMLGSFVGSVRVGGQDFALHRQIAFFSSQLQPSRTEKYGLPRRVGGTPLSRSPRPTRMRATKRQRHCRQQSSMLPTDTNTGQCSSSLRSLVGARLSARRKKAHWPILLVATRLTRTTRVSESRVGARLYSSTVPSGRKATSPSCRATSFSQTKTALSPRWTRLSASSEALMANWWSPCTTRHCPTAHNQRRYCSSCRQELRATFIRSSFFRAPSLERRAPAPDLVAMISEQPFGEVRADGV